MQRITEKMLKEKINVINNWIGSGETVGSYELSISMNSYKLVKILSKGRSQHTVLHAQSKKELGSMIEAFLQGIVEYDKKN